MLEPRTPETIHLWGGSLCLDYANSVDWSHDDEHVDPEQTDVLRTEDMLGAWGRRLALLSGGVKPPSATELERARALRDTVYRVVSSISRDQEPAKKDLNVLMSNYKEAVEHASLLVGESFCQLDCRAGAPKGPLRRRRRRRRAASESRPPAARQSLPRAQLRMAVPQHQRTPPLVLDVDLWQPREDAAAASTPHTTRRLSVFRLRTRAEANRV